MKDREREKYERGREICAYKELSVGQRRTAKESIYFLERNKFISSHLLQKREMLRGSDQ